MSEPVKKSQRWSEVFTDFISLLRIDSKETVATDVRGSPLILWGSQKRFLRAVCEGLDAGRRIFYCLKSRQVGLTTLSLVFDTFWMLMYPGTVGALVSNNPKNSEINRRAIRRYVESIPKGFLGKNFSILKDNEKFLIFSNGSRLDLLVAGKRSVSWGEGAGYTFAHLTEVSDYGKKEGLDSFRESLASNHPNRLVIYESTAKGFNFYRDMWLEAKKDVHTCVTTFVGWWSKELNIISKNDPRYKEHNYDPTSEEQELIDSVKELYGHKVTREQLAWYRWRSSQEDVDTNTLYQNQPWHENQAFVMTGFSFFNTRVLQKDLERIRNPDDPIVFKGYRYHLGNDFQAGVMEPITTMDQLDEVRLRVWEDPLDDAQYVIGCDPAWGRNEWKDRTAIEVYRCFADKLVQVAEYADNDIDTRQAAWVLAHLCGAYKNCMINIELTGGPGRAVLTELENLRERMRSDMYREQTRKDYDWDDFLQTARWYLYHKADSFGAGYAKGWDSTSSTKWELMCQIKDSHMTGMLLIRSVPLVEEMLTVVQDGSEIGAPGKAKDDRMFATALANRAWIDSVRNSMIQNGLSYDIVLARESNEERSKGAAFVDQIVINYMRAQEEYEPPLSARAQWLLDRGFA